MATQVRIDGETPNGGAYSIAYYSDDEGEAADKADATHVEIVEFDENSKSIFRTHGTLTADEDEISDDLAAEIDAAMDGE